MILEDALKSGVDLRNKFINENIDIYPYANKIQSSKDRLEFIDTILELTLKFNVEIKYTDYLIEILSKYGEDGKELFETVKINFLLGFLSPTEKETLSITKAAEIWKIARSTIYRAKEEGKLTENDFIGKKIKYRAMERVFGERK